VDCGRVYVYVYTLLPHTLPYAYRLRASGGCHRGSEREGESERGESERVGGGGTRAHAREGIRPGKDGVPCGQVPDGLPHTHALCSPSVVLSPVYR